MFNKLLIADSGKGHVEEMVRMLQDIPSMRSATVALLHVIPEQSKAGADGHRIDAEELLDSAINRMGLDRSRVTSLVREGDTKQTVLKVAEEQNCDLIVMGSRGLGRLQSILANSASQYVFQLSTRPMLLVRDDLYVRHVNRAMVQSTAPGVGTTPCAACELVKQIPGGTLTGVHVVSQETAPAVAASAKLTSYLRLPRSRPAALGLNSKA